MNDLSKLSEDLFGSLVAKITLDKSDLFIVNREKLLAKLDEFKEIDLNPTDGELEPPIDQYFGDEDDLGTCMIYT